MNITQKKLDDLSLQVTVAIDATDYEEKVKKALNDTRRKAEIKGFRKGMVPMSYIQKMYGRSILLEQVNTIMSEALTKYMEDEKIHIIGEPLASENQDKVDFATATEFTFSFDLMLAPQLNLTLDNSVHIPFHKPAITDETKATYVKGILDQNGTMETAPKVDREDFLKVNLIQGDKVIEDSYLNVKTIAKVKDKKPLLGLAVGDQVEADVAVLFPKEADRAALLKVKPEELNQFKSTVFTIKVNEIKRYVEAEENQALYDKLYGEGKVTTHEAFMEKVVEQMERSAEQEGNYRFAQDVRKQLVETAAIQLPEAMLKRWLYEGNDGKFTMEQIEKDFPAFLEDFRWQLVRESIMKANEIKVEKDDMVQSAVAMARYQFAMYGLNEVPDEHLIKYAESMLSDEKQARGLYERAEENKVIAFVREHVTVDTVIDQPEPKK